ncbi:uncharacterized protein I206_103434 [Kwoniella pini CBS 10737]|uniref:Chromo domain-containing protein n=1 Tax=Kwoniella pini CBS 10737 TaxID=1296096 RepID=A0A1B9I9R1_9TREE|nr:uncharacterized protein I206_01563 [Kwoniella pini CBS 10737]OCF52276.1 hypothetical protein I206_01563 [Kwoniella pini CBS 10737]
MDGPNGPSPGNAFSTSHKVAFDRDSSITISSTDSLSNSSSNTPATSTSASDETMTSLLNSADRERQNGGLTLYTTLTIIEDILKSQNELAENNNARWQKHVEYTNDKLKELTQLIDKAREETNATSNNFKAYIDETVEKAFQNIMNGEPSIHTTNRDTPAQSGSSSKRRRSQSRGISREIQGLNYPFFSAKLTKEKEKEKEKATVLSALPSNACSANKCSASQGEKTDDGPSKSSSVTRKATDIIDMTIDEEDDLRLRSASPVEILNCDNSPTPRASMKKVKPLERVSMGHKNTECRSATLINNISSTSRSSGSGDSKKRTFTALSRSDRFMMDKNAGRAGISSYKKTEASSIIGKKQVGTSLNGLKRVRYLVKRSDHTVSEATWELAKNIPDFGEKVIDLDQNCLEANIDIREKFVLLPEAKMFWDEKGNRRVGFNAG